MPTYRTESGYPTLIETCINCFYVFSIIFLLAVSSCWGIIERYRSICNNGETSHTLKASNN